MQKHILIRNGSIFLLFVIGYMIFQVEEHASTPSPSFGYIESPSPYIFQKNVPATPFVDEPNKDNAATADSYGIEPGDFLLKLQSSRIGHGTSVGLLIELLKEVPGELELTVYRAGIGELRFRALRSSLADSVLAEVGPSLLVTETSLLEIPPPANVGDIVTTISGKSLATYEKSGVIGAFERVLFNWSYTNETLSVLHAQFLMAGYKPGDRYQFGALRNGQHIELTGETFEKSLYSFVSTRHLVPLGIVLAGVLIVLIASGARKLGFLRIVGQIVCLWGCLYIYRVHPVMNSAILTLAAVVGLLYLAAWSLADGFEAPLSRNWYRRGNFGQIRWMLTLPFKIAIGTLKKVFGSPFFRAGAIGALIVAAATYFFAPDAVQPKEDGFLSISHLGKMLFLSGPVSYLIFWTFCTALVGLAIAFFKVVWPLANSNPGNESLWRAAQAGDHKRVRILLDDEDENLLPSHYRDLFRQMEQKLGSDPDHAALRSYRTDLLDSDERRVESALLASSWAQSTLPLLGFIGTIIGLAGAMVKLGDALVARAVEVEMLRDGFADVAFAFETTFIALAGTVIILALDEQIRNRASHYMENEAVFIDLCARGWSLSSQVTSIQVTEMAVQANRQVISGHMAQARQLVDQIIHETDHPIAVAIRKALLKPIIEFSEDGGELANNSLDQLAKAVQGKWASPERRNRDEESQPVLLSFGLPCQPAGIDQVYASVVFKLDSRNYYANLDFQGSVVGKPISIPDQFTEPDNSIGLPVISMPRSASALVFYGGSHYFMVLRGDTVSRRLHVKAPDGEKDMKIFFTGLIGPSTLDLTVMIANNQGDVDVVVSEECKERLATRRLPDRIYESWSQRPGSPVLFATARREEDALDDWSLFSVHCSINEDTENIADNALESQVDIQFGPMRPLPIRTSSIEITPISDHEVVLLDAENKLHYYDTELDRFSTLEDKDWRGKRVVGGTQGWLAVIEDDDHLRMWRARGGRLFPYNRYAAQPVSYAVAIDNTSCWQISGDGRRLHALAANRLVSWRIPSFVDEK